MGMVCASAGLLYFYKSMPEFQDVMQLPFDSKSMIASSSVTHLVVAGFLVGMGTDLSNGCTSGHGLCGMPRLSVRSLTAVMSFLGTALATATLSLKSFIPEVSQLNLPILDKISIPP